MNDSNKVTFYSVMDRKPDEIHAVMTVIYITVKSIVVVQDTC